MANQVTITGKEGPAIAVTTKLYPNISKITFDLTAFLVKIVKSDGNTEDVDISAATTVSCTVSGAAGTFQFTVS